MENNTLALLQSNPSKTAIAEIVDQFAQAIDDGHMLAIDVSVNIAALETLAKELRSRISENVISELFNHPKQKAEIKGAVVSIMETVKYDFSHIDEWSVLEGIIQQSREKQKEIEEEEKKWRRGELPVKSAATTFKIQLSK